MRTNFVDCIRPKNNYNFFSMQSNLFETHVYLVFILEATSNHITPTQLLGRILWDLYHMSIILL